MRRASRPEATPQRLDPLSTLTVRRAAAIFSAVALIDAVASTLGHTGEIRSPLAAVLALVALLAACAVIVTASGLRRAPVSRLAHVGTVTLALLAYALSAVSTWGGNSVLEDDWGQYAIALLVATVALTRPAAEIVVVGALAAVGAGVIAALQSPFLRVSAVPVVYAVVAATPILALSVAAAAYSIDMVRQIRRWQRSARAALLRLEPGVRESAARTLRQGEVTLLNQGAVPLMAAILERDAITADDASRAREVAATLRARTVAAVERTWLHSAVYRAIGGDLTVPPTGVDDPERLALTASSELRAAVTAFLSAAARLPGFERDSLRVTIRPSCGPPLPPLAPDPLVEEREERARLETSRLRRLFRGDASLPLVEERDEGARLETSPPSANPREDVDAPARAPLLPGWRLRVHAKVDAPERQSRATLAPYLVVLRVLTRRARLTCTRETIALEFDHEH